MAFINPQAAENRHLSARRGESQVMYRLIASELIQREQRTELPALTPQRASELYEQWRKGYHADIQRVWDELELLDEDLAVVLDKRQRALEQMPWRVEVDASAVGEAPARGLLASQQQAYIQQRLNAVENLVEAVTYLGMADFHGVAALELTGTPERERWEVIEPWLLARPTRRGPWYYNATAASTPTFLEELDPQSVIVREARPLSLPAMYLIVAKQHAIMGWDGFLEAFGNPSLFAELPAGLSEQDAKELHLLVTRIISEGRGTIPNGTKFTTVETKQNNCEAFKTRAAWCRESIITLGTGGQLTVMSAPGSGTLAGNAHENSFESIMAGTAKSISDTINRQWVRRVLADIFPEAPVLVKFTLAPEQADERAAMADLLGKLNVAGYQMETDEAASELAGVPIKRLPPPSTLPAPATGTIITNRAPSSPESEGEPPLTEEELEAFRSLAHPNRERMEQRRWQVETHLRQAADLPPTEPDDTVENGCNQYGHEPGCPDAAPSPPDADPSTSSLPRPVDEGEPVPEEEQENPYADNPGWDEPEEELAENSKRPCQSQTPATCRRCNPSMQSAMQHAQKGGRSSKGNPAGKPTQSNTPLKAAEGATPSEQRKAVSKSIKATMKGGQVQGVFTRTSRGGGRGRQVTISAGKPGNNKGGGTTHMVAKHFKPGDINLQQAASVIVDGTMAKGAGANVISTSKGKLAAFRPTEEGLKLSSAYRRTKARLKSQDQPKK